MPLSPLDRRVHEETLRRIVETGHAPAWGDVAGRLALPVAEVVSSVRSLHDQHGLVLKPGSLDVWSIHPFALLPTAFWVASANGGWWANCAWCSLGIGAAVGRDVRIVTRNGAEGEPLTISVSGDRASPEGVVIHFPTPPPRWWDNPYAPCAAILFFADASRVDAWCSRHGQPKGSVLTLAQGLALGRAWFGDYLSPEWDRKTKEQATEVFRSLDLDPAFWTLDEPGKPPVPWR